MYAHQPKSEMTVRKVSSTREVERRVDAGLRGEEEDDGVKAAMATFRLWRA